MYTLHLKIFFFCNTSLTRQEDDLFCRWSLRSIRIFRGKWNSTCDKGHYKSPLITGTAPNLPFKYALRVSWPSCTLKSDNGLSLDSPNVFFSTNQISSFLKSFKNHFPLVSKDKYFLNILSISEAFSGKDLCRQVW